MTDLLRIHRLILCTIYICTTREEAITKEGHPSISRASLTVRITFEEVRIGNGAEGSLELEKDGGLASGAVCRCC